MGSSKICVTFGNVSSAFSTGNVFDRKSRVRFRISSLNGDFLNIILVNWQWQLIEFKLFWWCLLWFQCVQWIWFAQNILPHWIARYLALIQIATYIGNAYKSVFAWYIFAFEVDVCIWWRANARWYSRCWFNKCIISAEKWKKSNIKILDWKWARSISFLLHIYLSHPSGGSSSSICGPSCVSTMAALCKSKRI